MSQKERFFCDKKKAFPVTKRMNFLSQKKVKRSVFKEEKTMTGVNIFLYEQDSCENLTQHLSTYLPLGCCQIGEHCE